MSISMTNGTRLYAMAWRNLWRNRRRTLITLSALVFGVLLAVIFASIRDSSLGEAVDLAARLGAGHVTLQHPEYLETPSTSRTVREASAQERRARALPGVTGAVPRIVGQLMLATAGQNQATQFVAYDPRVESESTLPLLASVPDAERFRAPAGPGIILGAGLAANLDTAMGRKVVYTMTDRRGEIVTGLARVSGILKTGAAGVDNNLCLLPIDTVRAALGYGPDEATFVAVFLADHRRSPEIARRLGEDAKRDRTADVQSDAVHANDANANESAKAIASDKSAKSMPPVALTWREVQPDLAAFIAMKGSGTVVMGVIMLLLTAAGIFNTLFVSVMERLREFGILMAIGFSPARLFRLVLWESLWLGVVGVIAGLAVTAVPYWLLATRGIDTTRLSGGGRIEIAGALMSTVLRARIYPENLFAILAIVLGATLLSGVYPAWRAARVAPVDAIKLV